MTGPTAAVRSAAGRPAIRERPLEAVGGRQDHAHLVPGIGDRVAEGVHSAFGIGREAGVRDKEHARGAERDEGRAGGDDARPTGRGGVVARAAGNDDGAVDAPAPREIGRELARGLAALDETRHLGAGQPGRLEKIVGPVAQRDVEPERARGVRHLGDVVAGEAEAHIVLGQKHHVDALEEIRLVLCASTGSWAP